MTKLYDRPFVNTASETIPAFGVLEIGGWADDAGGLSVFQAIKPTKDGKLYLINGPLPVPVGRKGWATRGHGHWALYVSTALPKINEEFGPKAGSWALHKDDGNKGGFIIVDDPRGTAAPAPGLPVGVSTKRIRVAWGVASVDPPPVRCYAMLIKEIPAATKKGLPAPEITPGYAKEACYPLEWSDFSLTEKLTAERDDDEKLIKLDVLNPKWLFKIFASDTDKECVIATGTKEVRKTYSAGNPEEKLVFVIETINYPVTIVVARAQGAVRGEDFPALITETLWGLPPDTELVTFKNPDAWEGDDEAYCLGIRRQEDWEWQAIDLACPEAQEGY